MKTRNITEVPTSVTDEEPVLGVTEQLLEDAHSKAFEEASVAAHEEFIAFREATTNWPSYEYDESHEWLKRFKEARSATRRLMEVVGQQLAIGMPVVDAHVASLARVYVLHPAVAPVAPLVGPVTKEELLQSRVPICALVGPVEMTKLLFGRVALSRGVPSGIVVPSGIRDADWWSEEFFEFMLAGEDLLGVDYSSGQKRSG